MGITESIGRVSSARFSGNQQSMPVPVGFMRAGSTTAIPALLKSRGHEPDIVADRLGVDVRLLHDPDALIPITDLSRIIVGCADLNGCSHIGLLLGQLVNLSMFGIAGRLAGHANDVGSALRDIVRHLHLHGSGVIARLDVEGDTAIFSHSSYDSGFECADQIADRAMAGVCNMIRTMCGINWALDEVRLPHRRPQDVAPFNNYFRAPVRFDQEEAALIFPSYWLQRRVPGADPEMHRLIAGYLEKADACAEHDITDQLRRAVRKLVVNRKCSADRVAQLFSVHRRTMSRRLKQEGTHFHSLLEDTKFQVARQLVRDTDLPFAQIAAVLNYSEAGAFTRAFRRWSGSSPTQWREKNIQR